MTESEPRQVDAAAVDQVTKALRLASASLPHLSGLARLVRIKPTRRVSVAAIGASGLLIIQPEVFTRIPLADAAFILAHELMHLALDTHGRQGDAHALLVNIAHDYIINDMLEEELERLPPLDGLQMEGARFRSLEELVTELSSSAGSRKLRCWTAEAERQREAPGQGRSNLARALEDAGLVEPPVTQQIPVSVVPPELDRGDVIPLPWEEQLEPEISSDRRASIVHQVRRAAAKAASLAGLQEKLAAADQLIDWGEPQRGAELLRALRDAYRTPWELILQRWIDAMAPGERTYARPSRRSADRRDVVLPGRRREGWALHILLDTSGSMYQVLPRALGAIASFCEAAGVLDVHVIQCDVEVTRDQWVRPEELAEFQVAGFGYSDMSPAMQALAEDPHVEGLLVLTDGYIDFPPEIMPYRVLWVLIGPSDPNFDPPYGDVLRMLLLQA